MSHFMVIGSLALLSVLTVNCGGKSSKKNAPAPAETTTESPVVGSLKRAGAISSGYACTQNYIPGQESVLESMKNEYFTSVASCFDAKFTIACVPNDLKTRSASQRGLVNWYNGSGCPSETTPFTDEKLAMEFLEKTIQDAE